MAKKIKKQDFIAEFKDSEELLQFYNVINENIVHVTTLLMCSKMLRTNQFDSIKIKQYLLKYNSTYCPQCGNNVDKTVCILEKMAVAVINEALLPTFPQYANPIYTEKINKIHSKLPLCDIRFLLEGVFYQEKSKELALGNSNVAQDDYNNLMRYYKERLNYSDFLMGVLIKIPITTEKDKGVFDEIKQFINSI